MTETEHKEVLAWNDDLGRLVVVNKSSLEREVLQPIVEKVESTPIVETPTQQKVESDPINEHSETIDFSDFDDTEEEDFDEGYW